MKHTLRGVVLVLLLGPLGLGQSRSAAQWRADLASLADALTHRHMNFFAHLSQDDFNTAVTTLDSSIPSMTDSQIRAALARLVALGQDSHTYLDISSASRLFGFIATHFDNGWYLTATGLGNSDKIGYRLLALGGVDADSLPDLVAPFISHDNRAWLIRNTGGYLSLEDILSAAGLLTSNGTVILDLQALDGSNLSLELAPASAIPFITADYTVASLPYYRQRPYDYYWYQYDAPTRLLYIRYRVCAEEPGTPAYPFWQEVLSVFDQNRVDRLVIDYRDNGGGDDSIIDPLMWGLRDRFSKLGNPTRLYALTNDGTFSSALLDVSAFKEAEVMMGVPFIRIVGQPTGGNPNSYGNVYTYQLPNSGLYYQLSTRYFGMMFKEDSLQPDILIPLRSDQYFSGQDPVLDAIVSGNADSQSVAPRPAGMPNRPKALVRRPVSPSPLR